MPNLVYSLQDDAAVCEFSAPDGSTLKVPIRDLSASGARLETGQAFEDNEYIDITMLMGSSRRESLFAQVVSSGDKGLELRWLHFDPGEEDRLRGILEEFATTQGVQGVDKELFTGGKSKKRETRRVARPRKATEDTETAEADSKKRKSGDSAIMPFAGPKTGAVKPKTKTVPAAAAADGEQKKKKTSRRIVKPRSGTDATPASGTQQAVAGETSQSSRRRAARRVTRDASGEHEQVTPGPRATDSGPQTLTQDSVALTPAKGNPTIGEDSGGRHVVIEPTARFNKLNSDPTGPLPAQKKKKKKKRPDEPPTKLVTKDGRIDVGASLKSRAKTVRASDLAARHDKVRVLNMSTIKELIQAAVNEALDRLGGAISEEQRKLLLKEAEDEFQEQMRAFKAEKEGLQAQTRNLEDQLQRAEKMLDEERQRKISADQFTVSESSMEDLQKRFDRLVNHAIKVNGVNDALADELRNMVMHVLDAERENIADQAKQAQNKAIAILEKKISRLANSLEDTEKERDQHMRRANALEASGGGVGNIMQAGLDYEDPDKERKLELLKAIFDQNMEMRDALQQEGIEIKGREKPVAPAPVAGAEAAAEGAAEVPAEPEAPADDVPAAAAEEAAAEPVAEADAGSADDGDGDGDDPYGDMADPDDAVWEPGMSFATDVAGDNEGGEDDTVKKITSFDNFAPPPLERPGAASDDAAAGPEAADAEDSYELGDPDDEIWEPGTPVSSEPPGDDESESDNGVKKIADFKNFEPPPLQRKS